MSTNEHNDSQNGTDKERPIAPTFSVGSSHVASESESTNQTPLSLAGTPVRQSEFHVCAIGASAGGLEPIQTFFSNVPTDLGVAYVVIQHLSPNHDSRMPQILSRVTSMPVRLVDQCDDGILVQPNHVFLIPPGKDMVMQNSRLFLTDRDDDDQLTLPIDHFFLSMAQDQGRFAIAMVLSGTGADGAAGIKDIRRTGGLVMVQDPRTCKFDSMPEQAIATGLCDVVLPPEGLAEAFKRFVSQSLSREQIDQLEIASAEVPTSQEILKQLQNHSDIDFTIYKPDSVLRRIQRRQELRGYNTLALYSDQLRKDAGERDTLVADLLIGVTNFYRNKEAFDVLQHEAITKILSKREDGDEVRIWVAGCSTGEEAYTIAFILDEAIERLGKRLSVKLFATDANRTAIDFAAAGIYSDSAIRGLAQDKVDKYFIRQNETYQVVTRIRQQIVFVQHDLMKDAPFTRIDLVSCRNLLIYLQSPAQTKCLSLFHFSLNAGGFLFLGSSEAIGELEEEFQSINKTWRLYRKFRDVQLATNRAEAVRRAATSASLRLSLHREERALQLGPYVNRRSDGERQRLSDGQLQLAYDALLERLLPAGFLIDNFGRLLHTFGDGGDFLMMQSGRHSTQLVDLIVDELRSAMGAAIQHCHRYKKRVVYSGISFGRQAVGPQRQFDLAAEPLAQDDKGASLLLISLFEVEGARKIAAESARVDVSAASSENVQMLQNELMFTRENLQATIEELEANNEEMQATNEEMVSSNQELQSTNEELQSVNEELHTLNSEYHRKIAQLRDATDDMDNLLQASEVSVLFLDQSLCIRRFTPSLALLSGLRPADVGRVITSFQTTLVPPALVDVFKTVLANRDPVTTEIESSDGRLYSVRVTPFESSTVADGVVVNYVDSTSIRDQEDAAKRWASIVESTADCIIAMDLAGGITQWNPAAETLYGWSQADALGKNFYDLAIPRSHRGETAMRVEQVRSDQASTQFDSVRVNRFGQQLNVTSRLSPVFGSQGIVGISLIERDITALQRQARLRLFEQQVLSSPFLDRKTDAGVEDLDAAAAEGLRSRALWVWRIDSLTGELSTDFSSFGDGEQDWLDRNGIDLLALSQQAQASGDQVQCRVETPPPQGIAKGNASIDASVGFPISDDWRLVLSPLIHKTACVGVIGVLLNVSDGKSLDEILSTMAVVSRSLALQVFDENRLDELLRISEIVENASDFIGACDGSGRMISLNRAGRLLTGIGLDDDITTLSLSDLHVSESSDESMAEVIAIAARKGHWSGKAEIVDRKGHRLIVSQLITSHRDELARLNYFSVIDHVRSQQEGVHKKLAEVLREPRRES